MKSVEKLYSELKKHLINHKEDKNFWNRDLIGVTIKNFCESRGNFRNSPRGNPAKGARVKRENEAARNGGFTE